MFISKKVILVIMEILDSCWVVLEWFWVDFMFFLVMVLCDWKW